MAKSITASSRIPLCKPFISQEEEKAAAEALRSGWVMQGPKVEEFERLIAEYVGVRHAVAVNSGTSALSLAYAAAGLKSGDTAVMPSHTFVATANAAMQVGVEPVFVDIARAYYNIDPAKIAPAVDSKTRGLVVVHQIGAAADMTALMAAAGKHNLILIEDAACSLGTAYNGRQTGSFGIASCLSFHPRKVITTGEGGMVLMDSDKLAQTARSLRNHGLTQDTSSSSFKCESPGFNYRLTDIQAAIGIVQLRKLSEIIRLRTRLAARYEAEISEIPALQLPQLPKGATTNHQSFVVEVIDDAISRDEIVAFMNERGIDCKPGIQPIHREPLYEGSASDENLPETMRAARHSFFLPIYPDMTDDEQGRVAQALRESIENCAGRRGM